MQIKDPEYLKSQIIRSLYSSTEADPASLADYIIALLKHDKPVHELEAYCVAQLQEFFHPGKVGPFMRDLLSYLTNGEQHPNFQSSSNQSSPSSHNQNHNQNQKAPQERKYERTSGRERANERTHERNERTHERNERSHERSTTHERSTRYYQEDRSQSTRRRSRSRSPVQKRKRDINVPQMVEIMDEETEKERRRFITVDRIPKESCNQDALIEYFTRFGPVNGVVIEENGRKAEICFVNADDAQSALDCPDAVLGNRFVRLFRSRPNYLRRTKPNRPPRLTPAQSTMISESKVREKQERLHNLLHLQKQKQELLDKYVAQQKELLAKLENPSLGEQERTVLKESILSLDRSIQQVQELNVPPAVPSRAQTRSPPLPVVVPQKIDRSKFKMDFRPGAFIVSPVPTLLRNDMESFRKILTSHGVLGNFRYDETSNSALIEYVNRQEASKVNPTWLFSNM